MIPLAQLGEALGGPGPPSLIFGGQILAAEGTHLLEDLNLLLDTVHTNTDNRDLLNLTSWADSRRNSHPIVCNQQISFSLFVDFFLLDSCSRASGN